MLLLIPVALTTVDAVVRATDSETRCWNKKSTIVSISGPKSCYRILGT